MIRFKVVFFFLFIYVNILGANQKTLFVIHSDFPKQNIWVKSLLEKSKKTIDKYFDHPLATQVKKITIIIRKDKRSKGISASADFKKNRLNFRSNLWQNDRYRRWILIHELANLLSARYGSQAYPSDWWSNGRSPFPVYVAWLVLKELRYTKDTYWLKKTYKNHIDQQLYWKLHEKYGPILFRHFFYYLKRDNIHLENIGKPWPYPDKQRALLTIKYLSMAAGEDLIPLFQKYDIGKEPSDWYKRHKNIKFIPYTLK